MRKAAITACSNAQQPQNRPRIEELAAYLQSIGIEPVMSSCIYSDDSVFSGTPREQVIAASKATFWGYSDLTTVINAIYTMTGKESVLYQVKNMVRGNHTAVQRERFRSRTDLFAPDITFAQKSAMKGVVVGGNIRCFLKLAGTRYFPDLQGKILLLESLGGEVPQMSTYLAQLGQLGAFDKVSGVLLGTFTTMEQNHCVPDMITLVKEICGQNIPLAKTAEIGHGDDSKAIVIGREIELSGC